MINLICVLFNHYINETIVIAKMHSADLGV